MPCTDCRTRPARRRGSAAGTCRVKISLPFATYQEHDSQIAPVCWSRQPHDGSQPCLARAQSARQSHIACSLSGASTACACDTSTWGPFPISAQKLTGTCPPAASPVNLTRQARPLKRPVGYSPNRRPASCVPRVDDKGPVEDFTPKHYQHDVRVFRSRALAFGS